MIDDPITDLRQRAISGELQAQAMLGLLSQLGCVVGPDLKDATKWYRSAADRGYAPAQYSLGCLLWTVEKDESISWFLKASSNEYSPAQLVLGRICLEGESEVWGAEKAVEEIRKASDQGYVLASKYLGILYCNGHLVKKDIELARSLFKRAADLGDEQSKTLFKQMSE